MSVKAKKIARLHSQHIAHSALDRKELEETRTDPDLTEKARKERVEELEERLQTKFDPLLQEARDLVAGAEREYVEHLPAAAQLRAATEKPTRAVEVRQLAEGASPDELRQIVGHLSAKGDLAGAHGLRRALRNAELPKEDHAAIAGVLDAIGGDTAEGYLRELVASKQTLLRFESAGPTNDLDGSIVRDPRGVIAATRAARTVPDTNGSTRSLSEAEVGRHLEAAGVA